MHVADGAPVTYAFSLVVGVASSASLLLDRGHLLSLDRDAVLTRSQYWRLVSSQLTFHQCVLNRNLTLCGGVSVILQYITLDCDIVGSGLAVSIGLYVVFQFRILERLLGSRKFSSIAVYVLLTSGALELAALTLAPLWLSKAIAGGPYSVLGAFAVYFYSTIGVTSEVSEVHKRSRLMRCVMVVDVQSMFQSCSLGC